MKVSITGTARLSRKLSFTSGQELELAEIFLRLTKMPSLSFLEAINIK